MSPESHGIYVAAAPGRLPPEGSPIVATLPLPPGRLIRPRPRLAGAVPIP